MEDPIARFKELFERAQKAVADREPPAMMLATVDERGRPSARVVLLRGLDERGFVFYTNYRSRKARELARPGAHAALCFWWPELDAQVRVEGPVEQVPAAESDAYFAGRPRGSQVGAWASDQSETLASREALAARVAELEKRFEGKPVPRPPHWGGFRVAPLAIEFWKNEPSRLHQRELYERAGPGAPWKVRLLYP